MVDDGAAAQAPSRRVIVAFDGMRTVGALGLHTPIVRDGDDFRCERQPPVRVRSNDLARLGEQGLVTILATPVEVRMVDPVVVYSDCDPDDRHRGLLEPLCIGDEDVGVRIEDALPGHKGRYFVAWVCESSDLPALCMRLFGRIFDRLRESPGALPIRARWDAVQWAEYLLPYMSPADAASATEENLAWMLALASTGCIENVTTGNIRFDMKVKLRGLPDPAKAARRVNEEAVRLLGLFCLELGPCPVADAWRPFPAPAEEVRACTAWFQRSHADRANHRFGAPWYATSSAWHGVKYLWLRCLHAGVVETFVGHRWRVVDWLDGDVVRPILGGLVEHGVAAEGVVKS